jgi:TRAP-type C4-dicarboxylate transport system, small permease component
MKSQTRLGRWLDRLGSGMMIVAILFLAAMAVLMNVEIAGRTLFKTSTMIADEYSGYFFSWLFLCSLMHVQRADGLLTVTILIDRLPERVVRFLDAFAALASGVLTGILTWATFEMAYSNWSFGSTSLTTAETPLFIPQVIMPLGLGIVTLSFFETAVSRLLGLAKPADNAAGSVI